MTPDIKHRIEQIRRDELPERYKKTKAGIMPEEWEEKFIKDISSDIYAGATPETKVPEYWKNGTIPWLASGEIHKRRICQTEKSITEKGYLSSSTKMLPENCVLIALAGQGKTRGTVAVNKIPLCTNQSIAAIIPNNCYYQYLYYFLDIRYNNLREISSGDGTRGGLNLNLISNYPVTLPPLPEQQKIADILTTQDKVIELKEQLLAKKQQQKKYLMQQLLTGKKRLPGFSGKWRKEQVRNLCTVVKGEQLNKDILDEIGLYYVLNGGMTPSGYTNKWNIMENTISISEGGNSCGYVNFNREKFWSGGHCYTLQFVKTSEIMNLFLYFYLKFCENKLQCLRVGSGLPNIQKSSLENFNVTYPTLEEQTAIANVLSAADREIDLLRQSIEAEKQKKKALMQLLLTGIVRVTV